MLTGVVVDRIEIIRRSTLWRVWVWGTRIFVSGLATTAVFGSVFAGHLPRWVATAVLLFGMACTAAGFVGYATGLLALGSEYSALFKNRQTAVFGAFVKDLVTPRRPPPLVEPSWKVPWPPPMWHGDIPAPEPETDTTRP